MQLAQNLGRKSIFIGKENRADAALTTTSWVDIYTFLAKQPRKALRIETRMKQNIGEVNPDGSGKASISTG